MIWYSFEQLRQMAEKGQIRREQQFYDRRYGWVRADAIPEVRPAFRPDLRPLFSLLAAGGLAYLGLQAAENARLAQLSWEERRRAIFKRDDYTCAYCGHRGTSATLEVDHKIPLARGGTDDAGNLATACWPCNREKGTMTALEFRLQRLLR